MGISVSKTLLMMVVLIAGAAFSVLRLDLNNKYNPGKMNWIAIAAEMERSATYSKFSEYSSAMNDEEPTASHVVKTTIRVAPSSQSIPIKAAKPAAIPKNQLPTGPSLWIFVEVFAEGMASWRISLAEILMIAKKLNATVVEPCILRGRLRACDDYTARLDQVYDVTKLRKFYSNMVSYEDYQTMVTMEKPVMVPMCLQKPTGNPPIKRVCGKAPNIYSSTVNAPLEKALEHKKKGPTVIQIKYYRQGGFHKTRVGGETLVNFRKTGQILEQYFAFARQHYDIVDYLLQLMGVSNTSGYDVIHWRAEKPDIHYNDCATKILQIRKTMGSKTTVLLSSINHEVDMQWYKPEMYNQSDAIRSLDRLLDSGFLKVDQVLDKVQNMIPDQIVIPVWDQIIAQKARRFATCTEGCGRSHRCAACNFLGNFAQTAVDLRKQSGKSSDECWPV